MDVLTVLDRAIAESERSMRHRGGVATGGGEPPRNSELREARADVADLIDALRNCPCFCEDEDGDGDAVTCDRCRALAKVQP